MANRALAEHRFRHCYDVVTADDAGFRKTFVGSDLDLGAHPAEGPGDRSASNRRKDLDCGIPRQYADGTATDWSTEVGPHDVASGYHSGTVSAASRAADWTTSGSCGVRR